MKKKAIVFQPVLFLALAALSLFLIFSCGKRNVTVIGTDSTGTSGYGGYESGDISRTGEYGQLNITFTKDVIGLSDFDAMTNEIRKKITLRTSPEIKGEWRPFSSTEIAFVFKEPLKLSTRYTVTINADKIVALDGTAPDITVNGQGISGNNYEFTTERIIVQELIPESRFTDTRVSLTFNVPVRIEELLPKFKIYDKENSDKPVPYSAAYTVQTNTRESNNVILTTITTNLRRFIITPRGLKKAGHYGMTVEEGLNALGGNEGLEKNFGGSLDTYQPLEFSKLTTSDYDWRTSSYHFYPDSTLIFEFNNEIQGDTNILKHLKVEPKVEKLTASVSDNRIYLNGNFIGATSYKITFLAGLPDIYGQKLAAASEQDVEIEHGYSIFGMPYGYMVMENYLPPILPFKIRNVSEMEFSYVFLDDIQEIGSYLRFSGAERNNFLADRLKKKNIRLNWQYDKFYNYRLDLTKMKKKPSGILLYEANAKLENGYNDASTNMKSGIILFTDMGISVKSGPNQTMVFVRRLRDNSPVADAVIYDVDYSSNTVKVIKKGKTDSKGTLTFASGYPMPLLIAEKNGNITLNYGVSHYYEDYYDDDYYNGGRRVNSGANVVHEGTDYYLTETRVLLFTERFLYKPGETVDVKGIVRYRLNDDWNPLASSPTNSRFKFSVKDSRNAELGTYDVETDSWGSFHFKFRIPEGSPTGYYSIREENKYQGTEFSVQDFKPAKAEMKILPSKTDFIWGDKFDADIIGWYLFGAPVMKPIKYGINVSPTTFQSARYWQYNFGGNWWYDESDYRRRDYAFTLTSGTGFPDKNGKVHVASLISKGDFKGDALITISASTILDDDSTVFGTKPGINLFNPVHIGIRAQDYFVQAGSSINIQLIALDSKEEIAKDQPVSLQVEKREWKSYQKAGVNGRLEWHWDMINTKIYDQSFTIGKKDAGVSVKDPGYYVARATTVVRGHENVSEDSFYAYGNGNFGWKVDNSYNIELESDKKAYRVGDTAKILVKNPFKNCTALVTVEREKVHTMEQIELHDSIAVIPVKITEAFIPNAYVSVMLFTGRSGTNQVKDDEDLARPNYRIGYINLNITPEEKKLKIAVKADKENYRPGDKANVTVEVRDWQGRTVKDAEVTVAVVDKGILNLVNYQLPDPLQTFYQPRSLAVYTSEMREFIFGQRYLSEKGEVIGGDGSAYLSALGLGSINPRLDFRSTAFFFDKLMVKNGKAAFTFKIPDNLTTWKIMAVSQTKNSCFGYGDNAVTVSKPLMLLPTLPRFVRLGDKVEAGGIVYNYTGNDATVSVGIKADKDLSFHTPQATNFRLANNKSAEVKFRFDVPVQELDDIHFTLLAKTGSAEDGAIETVPIKNPRNLETITVYRKTETSRTEKVNITPNVLPEFSRIDVSVSPSAFTELKGNVDYLVHYPYGCLEQKASCILPLILSEDAIVKLGLLKSKTKEELRQIVTQVLAEFPNFMGRESFNYWTGDGSQYGPNAYLTVYATFVLTMAKKKGYDIPADLYEKAHNWTRAYADGKGAMERNYYGYYDDLTRCFALYVSAMNGYQNTASLKEAYQKVAGLHSDNVAANAYILKALNLYGNFDAKKQMIKDITGNFMKKATINSTTCEFKVFDQWDWFYYTRNISTAIILQALLEVDYQFVDYHKVINWLVQERKGDYWLSTHENAMIYWAFNTYLEKFEKTDPQFTAKVSLNSKELLSAVFSGRMDKMRSASGKLEATTKGSQTVSISKNGKGLLYYFLHYRYALKKYPARRDVGFSLNKTIYDYETGNAVTDGKFIRGTRYIVKIELSTGQDRNFVVIDDQLPAGFEPVNLDFVTEGNEKNVPTGSVNNNDWWWYYWGEFYNHEQYRDRVIYTANHLRSGQHTVQYLVRATTAGVFQVPFTRAEEMYNPEVFGYVSQPEVRVVEEENK